MSIAFLIIPPNQVTDNKPTEFLMEYQSNKDVSLINLVEFSVASAKPFLGAFFVVCFATVTQIRRTAFTRKKNYLKRAF